MVTITYDQLNELVHNVAGEIEKTTGLSREIFNLFTLNDTLVQYLDAYGVQYDDDWSDCEGHEPGPLEPMGITVYCDGSCKRQ